MASIAGEYDDGDAPATVGHSGRKMDELAFGPAEYFSLMILGLANTLPATLDHGLVAQGVPKADAARVSHLPPVGLLFASFSLA